MKMNKKTGILAILIAIIGIGVGYAVVTAVPLIINGSGTITPDESNFNVVYTACEVTSKNPATVTGSCTANNTTTATFSVEDMTKKNDTITFTFTITNNSNNLNADLTKAETYITNNNTEYFTVTETTFATTELAPGETTTQVVTVKVEKTPIGSSDITGTFKLELNADPKN